MEKAIKDLKESIANVDFNELKRCLSLLATKTKEAPEEELKKHNIDMLIKTVLRKNPCVEILDKIEELLVAIKSPILILEELDRFTIQEHLAVPTLMLIFEMQNRFDIHYDTFYKKLETTVIKENVISEGYLLFVLKSLQNKRLHENEIIPIVRRLADLTTEVKSGACIKVLYSIIVILRMHPGCFKIVPSLKKLYLLLESFNEISTITKRIFLEAENPELRPSVVFLKNFTFPSL